jgi:hypothetical protein
VKHLLNKHSNDVSHFGGLFLFHISFYIIVKASKGESGRGLSGHLTGPVDDNGPCCVQIVFENDIAWQSVSPVGVSYIV